MKRVLKYGVINWTILLLCVHSIFIHQHIAAKTNSEKGFAPQQDVSENLLYAILSLNPGGDHFTNVLIEPADLKQEVSIYVLLLYTSVMMLPLAATINSQQKSIDYAAALSSVFPDTFRYLRGPPMSL